MRKDNSNSSFLRKFYDQNLDNLLKIKQKRDRIAAANFSSASTVKKIERPSSDSRLFKPKVQHHSASKPTLQKKIYNSLAKQLKDIKESISKLQPKPSKPKKQIRQSLKMLTEPTQDPKSRILREVQHQFDEIKQVKQVPLQPQRQPPVHTHSPTSEEQTMFYGMDFIDGIQFKIKIKMNTEKYYLMAKNAHAKLLLEMGAEQYMELHNSLFRRNPCGIFHYLRVNNNQLYLKIGQRKLQKSVKTYLTYY